MSVGGTTTQTIDYTGDGNMGNLSPGIQAPGGSLITALGWNQNARFSALKAGSDILATYTYDGFGQRLMKTISKSNVTLYQYGQDGLLLEEATYKGVPQADYIYLDGRPIATLTSSGALDFLRGVWLWLSLKRPGVSTGTKWPVWLRVASRQKSKAVL
jgi:hypothetical protein